MASQTLLLGNRTTTWDRPPLASEALSRTATLLESARVTQSAILPLTGARADSAGLVSGHPPAQVPPTTLQELRPLQTAPLVRLGTWSEAPQAQIVPAWRPHQASGDPKLATGLAACGTGVPVSAVRLAPALQRASTSGPTAVLPLQRAATTGPPVVAMPMAPAPVQLQRSGTLTLDIRSQPSVRGVTLQRAPSLVVQSSPVPVQMQVVPCQLGAAVRPVQVTRVAAKAPLSQEHVPEIGRLLLQSAFTVKEQKPKQLRLVVAGLMGSGKSTICRMLRHLFQGCWINQDEFSHLGKGAKKAFLAAIEKAAADETVPVLLVDKINTMKQHREEIVNAMNRGKPGASSFWFHLVSAPVGSLLAMMFPQDGCGRRAMGKTIRKPSELVIPVIPSQSGALWLGHTWPLIQAGLKYGTPTIPNIYVISGLSSFSHWHCHHCHKLGELKSRSYHQIVIFLPSKTYVLNSHLIPWISSASSLVLSPRGPLESPVRQPGLHPGEAPGGRRPLGPDVAALRESHRQARRGPPHPEGFAAVAGHPTEDGDWEATDGWEILFEKMFEVLIDLYR